MLNMIELINKITYPCLIIDIGSSRIPKSFNKSGCIDGIEIFECLISYIETEDSNPDESNLSHFNIQNQPEEIENFLNAINQYLKKCTVVAHNSETDIKLILGMASRLGVEMTSKIKSFCTMRNGTSYSTTHVYRGGKKVKKYPHLQELYKNLTGDHVGKGDIYSDLFQCYICFKYLEKDILIKNA